jgi:hypothetical protein
VDAIGSGIDDAAVATTAASSVPPSRLNALRRFAAHSAGHVPQGLLAFAIYLVTFVVTAGMPLISHLNVPNLRQYWTDVQFYAWALGWWPYAVSHGINPLFSSQIGAPHGYDLAWASTAPSVDLLMWPVTAAFGAVVSYNIVLLLIPPLSGWAAFLAARRLTGRFWPSLLAGAVYGFCPYELMHTWQGQPNLTVIAVFPLMVYLVLRWWDGSMTSVWFVGWLALAMALEFYTFNEAFFDMTAVLAGGLVIGLAVAGRAAWRKAARLAGLAGIAYAAAIALAAPYLDYALRHNAGAFNRQASEYSLRLVRLVLPWGDKVFGIKGLASYSGTVGRGGIDDYVSVPLLLVLLAIAVFAWRRRITRLLVIGFVFVIALAAGPELFVGTGPLVHLPWGGLWSLPIARSAEPSRFTVFAVLILAVALALWLASSPKSGAPKSRSPKDRLVSVARWALGLLAVAAVLFDTPTAYQAVNPLPPGYQPPATMQPVNQLPPFITQGMYRRYLQPGETVVIVTHRGNAGMLFQAAAGFYFRIAGGFINASLTPKNALPHPITLAAHPSPVADAQLAGYLRSSGLGAIVVEQAWEDPWMRNFSARLDMRGTSVGGVTVYQVRPWLASQARLAILSHRAHLAHLGRRPHHPGPPLPQLPPFPRLPHQAHRQ